MKLNKTIGILGLCLGITSVASAEDVYLTGSTAFRSQVITALSSDLGLSVKQGNSSLFQITFSGTISTNSIGAGKPTMTGFPAGFLGSTVNVYCNWSGSAEGVGALDNNTVATYDSAASTGTFTFAGADLAFSDVDQNSTPNAAGDLSEILLSTDQARGGVPGTGIAVQAFAFVANSNAFAALGITNLSDEQFGELYSAGTLAASYWSGNGTSTTPVYAVGRYDLSGTRITTVLDDYGNLDTITLDDAANPLHQYALTTGGGSAPGLASTDTTVVPQTSTAWISVGNNGYFSGGNVEAALDVSTSNSLPAAIGYLGLSDANKLAHNHTNVSGPILWKGEWPGVVGNWNLSGIENGSYNFWSYERFYYNPAGNADSYDINTFGPGLAIAVQYEIKNASPRTAVLEPEMNVYKGQDGGAIIHY